MIDINALKPGDLVQLVSGSPLMTVRGFWGPVRAAKPGRSAPEMTRQKVTCVVWVQRVGFVQHDFAPCELKLPPPRAPKAVAPEGGGDDAAARDGALRDEIVIRASAATVERLRALWAPLDPTVRIPNWRAP